MWDQGLNIGWFESLWRCTH